jgi:hypothetical protein
VSTSRVYRRSLAALAVIAPLALWTASGEDYLDYRRKNAVVETVVASGAVQTYGGSDWRVDRHQAWTGALPAVDGARTLSTTAATLPAGVSLLRVRIAVRAKDADALGRLSRCELELADDRGRRWTPQSVQPELRRDVATRCSGSYADPPQVALEFRFEQDFLVPADTADRVDAVIRLADEKPRLLRLQLR